MNVISIITDTMRIDDLGCYGNETIQTPCLDRLASESVRFTRYYTEGLPTVPARRAYHTGRYTLRYKGWEALAPDETSSRRSSGNRDSSLRSRPTSTTFSARGWALAAGSGT